MKRRLVLFLAVFGASLTLLAILLQGDEIIRDNEKTVISPTPTGLGDGALSVNSGTSQFVVEQLPERLELPVGEERRYVDDDGVARTFSAGTLVLPDTDLFDEGLLSSNPFLEMFGSTPDERVADVKASRAAIYTYGPVEFENFASNDLPDVRRVFLTEGVEATLHGSDGEPSLLLKTSQMQMEIPPDWDGGLGLPPVVCPQPLELRRSDDSLVLRGSSAELDPSRRSIVIHPPVEVLAQVNGLGDRLGGRSGDPADSGPLLLQCEGDL